MFVLVLQSRHTVMIRWIPSIVHREDILLHFQLVPPFFSITSIVCELWTISNREAMPQAQVCDLQFAYDVSTLTKLSKKLWVFKYSATIHFLMQQMSAIHKDCALTCLLRADNVIVIMHTHPPCPLPISARPEIRSRRSCRVWGAWRRSLGLFRG